VTDEKTGWPKALVLVRTYRREYLDAEEVLKEIQENLADGFGIVLPSDKDRIQRHYTDVGRDYNEEYEKDEFLSSYPDVEWPPHTLQHLLEINKKDIEEQGMTVEDIFPEDDDHEDEWEVR
jgi:hypothetical protein